MRWIGALLVIAACHEGGTAVTDGPTGTDGTMIAPGLYVAWKAALPGALTERITVSEVTFDVERFEVLGDSTGGTSRSRFELTWSSSATPEDEVFRDAPPGVYSQIALTLGGGFSQDAYEIRGTWRNGSGEARRFKIEDRQALRMSLELSETLAAGGAATIGIEVELTDAIAEIDFRDLDEDDGVLELKTGHPQMQGFRSRLQRAFRLDD